MSQKSHRAQLLIEWDREWVRVHIVDSAQTREAGSLDGIDGIGNKSAIVFLSRRHVLHRAIALPDAPKPDAMVALKMKLGDIFPIPASELAFDFLPTTEKTENGRICNVFAARSSDIAELIEVCQRHGIQIEQIVPSQALTIKVSEQLAISSGVFAERFGDFVNLDAYRYGELVASKMATLNTLDTEVARMKALTGEGTKTVAFNVGLASVDTKLEHPYFEKYLQSQLSLDLEPEEYRLARVEKDRTRKHRVFYMVGILGVLIGLLTASDYMTNNSKYADAKAKNDRKTKMTTQITEAAEAKTAALKPQADQLKIAFVPAQQPSDILKVISSEVPADTWLTGVTFERGKIVQIRGVSKNPQSVSAYAQKLSKQNRFRDVRLVSANGGDIAGIPTVQFNITAFPVGNLPIIETGTKKKK